MNPNVEVKKVTLVCKAKQTIGYGQHNIWRSPQYIGLAVPWTITGPGTGVRSRLAVSKTFENILKLNRKGTKSSPCGQVVASGQGDLYIVEM